MTDTAKIQLPKLLDIRNGPAPAELQGAAMLHAVADLPPLRPVLTKRALAT